jgi:hypothetical protein
MNVDFLKVERIDTKKFLFQTPKELKVLKKKRRLELVEEKKNLKKKKKIYDSKFCVVENKHITLYSKKEGEDFINITHCLIDVGLKEGKKKLLFICDKKECFNKFFDFVDNNKLCDEKIMR